MRRSSEQKKVPQRLHAPTAGHSGCARQYALLKSQTGEEETAVMEQATGGDGLPTLPHFPGRLLAPYSFVAPFTSSAFTRWNWKVLWDALSATRVSVSPSTLKV